jgi:tetratricopeptide (TPR) repeat protein
VDNEAALLREFRNVAEVFISYKHIEPDKSLAAALADAIRSRHQVFIDTQIPLGKEWGDVIQDNLGGADFLTALVSQESAKSPMVLAEIEEAHRLNVTNRRPGIIPIRLKFEGQLRYPLSAYVNRFQQCTWNGPADTLRVTELVLKAIEAKPEKLQPATQRQAMLKRVRSDWIDGVLSKSLYKAARIDLGLKTQPGAVERGIDLIIQRPEEEPRPLASGERLLSLFDDQLGQLLILGAPGSGKTTLLLELARDLLDRAEGDENHPIPVVFNLSSWSHRPAPLANWITEELHLRSDVPRQLARDWGEREQILPLLDGLDEVAGDRREACVEAINAYRAEHGWVQMAVCSRIAEYEALAAKLRLPGAVVVQPLTRSQVEEYLNSAGSQLEGVKRAVRADPGLWELLETPLMISIVALAYKNRPADNIESAGTSMRARRDRLFEAYVSEMFKRRAKETRFTAEQIHKWLSWLASRMVVRGQTLFQVEDIRSDWVGLPHVQEIVLAGVILIATLLSGLIGWLNMSPLFADRGTSFHDTFFGKGTYIYFLFTAPVGLVHALLRSRGSMPAEVLEPSWPGLKNFISATARASLLGGVLGYALGGSGCAAEYASSGESWSWSDINETAVTMGEVGLIAFGFLGALGSLVKARIAGVRSSPNLVLYSSLRSSLGSFAGGVLLSTLIFAICRFWNVDDNAVIVAGKLLTFIGLFVAFEKGGYFLLDHFITRSILRRKNLIPWHLVRFLDTATERLFLRKVGGTYIFVHRTLLEYFAGEPCSNESLDQVSRLTDVDPTARQASLANQFPLKEAFDEVVRTALTDADPGARHRAEDELISAGNPPPLAMKVALEESLKTERLAVPAYHLIGRLIAAGVGITLPKLALTRRIKLAGAARRDKSQAAKLKLFEPAIISSLVGAILVLLYLSYAVKFDYEKQLGTIGLIFTALISPVIIVLLTRGWWYPPQGQPDKILNSLLDLFVLAILGSVFGLIVLNVFLIREIYIASGPVTSQPVLNAVAAGAIVFTTSAVGFVLGGGCFARLTLRRIARILTGISCGILALIAIVLASGVSGGPIGALCVVAIPVLFGLVFILAEVDRDTASSPSPSSKLNRFGPFLAVLLIGSVLVLASFPFFPEKKASIHEGPETRAGEAVRKTMFVYESDLENPLPLTLNDDRLVELIVPEGTYFDVAIWRNRAPSPRDLRNASGALDQARYPARIQEFLRRGTYQVRVASFPTEAELTKEGALSVLFAQLVKRIQAGPRPFESPVCTLMITASPAEGWPSSAKLPSPKSKFSNAVYLVNSANKIIHRSKYQAIETLSGAIELDPGNAEAYKLRGVAYSWLAEPELALKDLSNAIYLDPTIQRDPQLAVAYLLIGQFYLSQGLYDNALKSIIKANTLNLTRDAVPEAYLALGQAYFGLKSYDRALENLNKAIDLDHNLAEAYLTRGNAKRAIGDQSGGEQDIRTAHSKGYKD